MPAPSNLLHRVISNVSGAINAFEVGVLAYVDFYVAMLVNFYSCGDCQLAVGCFANLHKDCVYCDFAGFVGGVVD
jgi:hypothetical protein